MTLLTIAILLSVICVSVDSIHVPNENLDKKTLTTIGIKTIGWQSSETSSDTSNVNIFHNYSKISVQNENVDSYDRYSQPQTNSGKKNNDHLAKGPREEPFPSGTTTQEKVTGTLENTGQEEANLSHFDTWNGEGNQKQTFDQTASNNNHFVSRNSLLHHSSSSVNTKTSNHLQQNNFGKPKPKQNANAYQNSLELDKIREAERQNQETLSFLEYDQTPSATHNSYVQNAPPGFSQVNQGSYHKYKNNAGIENVMVPYSSCPQMATGQFIYQSSCHQFLDCWKGRGVVQNCAPGTLFNPQTLECDFPSKVHCLTDSGTYHSQQYRSTNAAYINERGIACPPEFSGVIPHKTDCSKFINCAQGVENVMQCPPGTLFSLKINNCDFPYNAECADWSVEFGGNNVDHASQGSNVHQAYEENRGNEQVSGGYSGTKTNGVWGQIQNSGSHQSGNDYLHTGSSQWISQNTLEKDGRYKDSEQHSGKGTNDGWGITEQTVSGEQRGNDHLHTGGSQWTSQTTLEQNQNGYHQSSGLDKYSSGSTINNAWENTHQTSWNNQGSGLDKYSTDSTTNNAWGNTQQTSLNNQGSGLDRYSGGSNTNDVRGNRQQGSGLDKHTTGSTTNNAWGNTQQTSFNNQGSGSDRYSGGSNTNDVRGNRQQGFGLDKHTTGSTTNNAWGNTQQSALNSQGSGLDRYSGGSTTNNAWESTQTSLNGQSSQTGSQWSSQNAGSNIYPQGGSNTQYTQSSFVSNKNGYHTESGSSSYPGYSNSAQNTQNQNVEIENKSFQNVDYGADSNPRCPQGVSGLLRHPTSCSKFLNCANGQTFIQECGPGTVFNPHSMVCDFPYNVDCSDYGDIIDVRIGPPRRNNQKSSTTTQQPSYRNDDRIEGASSNIQGQYVHNDNSGGDNSKQTLETVQCPDHPVGFYPHPTVCAKYFTCLNGNPIIYKCATGTVFNPVRRVCDIPQKVICYTSSPNGIDYTGQYHGESTSGSYNQNQGSFGQDSQQSSSSQNTQTTFELNQSGTQQKQDSFDQNKQHSTSGSYNQNGNPFARDNQQTSSNQNIQTTFEHDHSGTQQNQNKQSPSGSYNQNHNVFGQDNQEASSNQNTHTTFEHNQSGIQQNQDSFGQNKQQSFNQNTKSSGGIHQNSVSEHTTSSKSPNIGSGGVPKINSKFREVCGVQDFYCSANQCIPKSMECDGTKDCPNGIDEQNCGKFLDQFVTKENSVLAVREKERYSNLSLVDCAKSCLETKGFECRSFSYRTDAECFLSDSNIGSCGALIEAAPYKYYEVASLTVDCTNLYTCPSNKCINHTQICDGVNDCGDRSDEKNCPSESFGYEIRLAGSNNKHEGRIELKAFGKWGYICDDRFGMRDADVVCHELGFPLGALEIKGNSYYAKEVDISSVLYLMDDVVCLGNETSIKDCDFNGWGVSNCEPQEIVGVVCKTPVEKCPKDQFKCNTSQECIPLAFVCDNVFDCPDQSDESRECEAPSEIRLVNGKSEREGRVEIRHHGIWGTVCDDDFNDDAAKVVCNSLGYPGKAVVKKDGFFGEGDGPIWLDQVFCQGNETLVQQCTHWNWGEHNCEHSEDVGVICSSSGVTSQPIETEVKGNINAPVNVVEVPPEELLPSECGLRKNALFYIDETHFRVVQGSVARKGFYPWQASLRIKNSAKPTHWCGAIVISRKFVLTAAHCLLGFSKGSYVVVAGDYNTDDEEGTEQEVYIEDFYIHERFRSGQKMNNDIALVKLKGNGFLFTKDIQPICLPETNLPYTNQLNCTISGFGTVQTGQSGYSHDLRAGWVPIQPPEVCKMPHVYGSAITDGMFCAGLLDEGVDSCEGDSGGPLACLHNGVFTLYGITSWGQHCGHANKPGVYVKVSYYRDWIEKTMRKNII